MRDCPGTSAVDPRPLCQPTPLILCCGQTYYLPYDCFLATPDTEPKLGWAASVRSGMWVALVLLVAGGVGAASPWGQGIWPEWPTEEERGQQVVTRNVQTSRQRNNPFGRHPFVHHTIIPQRNKNTYSEQKEREQYEKKKLIPNHPKILNRRPPSSSKQPYYNQPFVLDTIIPQKNKNTYSKHKVREQYDKKKLIPHHPNIPLRRPASSSRPPHYTKTKPRLKVDFKSRWREYVRRWGDKKNHLVLKLPTIRLVTKHKPYRAVKHKPHRATKHKPHKATGHKANMHKATKGQHYGRNH